MCHYTSKHFGLKHPCLRCLHAFSRTDQLEAHQNDCLGMGKKPQRTVIAEAGENVINFRNYDKQMGVSFIVYADFEYLNIPVEVAPVNSEKSSTYQISKQALCSYCYVRIRSDGQAKLGEIFANTETMIMSDEGQASFA